MRHGVWLVWLLLAAVGLGCASPVSEAGCGIRARPATAAPLLWRAQLADDRGGVLYLFGSVHARANLPTWTLRNESR